MSHFITMPAWAHYGASSPAEWDRRSRLCDILAGAVAHLLTSSDGEDLENAKRAGRMALTVAGYRLSKED